jgi:hypothetical protein
VSCRYDVAFALANGGHRGVRLYRRRRGRHGPRVRHLIVGQVSRIGRGYHEDGHDQQLAMQAMMAFADPILLAHDPGPDTDAVSTSTSDLADHGRRKRPISHESTPGQGQKSAFPVRTPVHEHAGRCLVR